MSNLPERGSGLPRRPSRSVASILDDGVLVVVAVVGALVALKLLGVIVSTIWFLVKVGAVAGLVYVLLRALRSRAR